MSEIDVDDWLEKSINFLDILGMYSADQPKLLRMRFALFILISFCISGVFDFLFNCNSLDNYLDGLTTFLPSLFSIIYLYCFISKRRVLHEVVEIVRKNYIFHNHSIGAEIFGRKIVEYSRKFVVSSLVGYALMAVLLYFEKEGQNIHDAKAEGLPARGYIPLNLEKPYWYIIFLLYQGATIFIVTHTTIPIAIFFSTLLLHLRGQLYYLQERLIRISDLEDIKDQRKLLNECLKLHMLLIHFTERMQNGYASILAIHNYSPGLVISVVAYQASMMSIMDPKFIPYMSILNYVLIECFVYCYFGQQIINESERVGFVAYSNKWYNSPPSIGKDLKLIIMRSQRSLRLKFIGSTDASLETYHNIVKTGYSYFMFLSGMNSPDEE